MNKIEELNILTYAEKKLLDEKHKTIDMLEMINTIKKRRTIISRELKNILNCMNGCKFFVEEYNSLNLNDKCRYYFNEEFNKFYIQFDKNTWDNDKIKNELKLKYLNNYKESIVFYIKYDNNSVQDC